MKEKHPKGLRTGSHPNTNQAIFPSNKWRGIFGPPCALGWEFESTGTTSGFEGNPNFMQYAARHEACQMGIQAESRVCKEQTGLWLSLARLDLRIDVLSTRTEERFATLPGYHRNEDVGIRERKMWADKHDMHDRLSAGGLTAYSCATSGAIGCSSGELPPTCRLDTGSTSSPRR